ncbi:acetate kinase [Ruminococcaceae bacterium OttesenSCG-928-L11]|nr:acetate kinase [Ruminococcaceae bacterium OttesenSCG-928-L11]
MKVLVINAGSSSLKYQLIDMENEGVLAKGNCERIGIDGLITHKTSDYTDQHETSFPTHAEAFKEVVKMLSTGDHAVISDMAEISAVGHRVVQGAELFSSSVKVTNEILDELETISDLAPLHNPANLTAIRACQSLFDASVPQVIVFDTAFHQTMPKKAYMYPIPYEMYEKYHIRRYGFHGTSHRFVSMKLAETVGKPLSQMKIVTCHLGNGSSITAIDGGKSIDTSMGFTPLDGIIMGTRSGSVDPSIVTYIQEKENLGPKEINDLLNKKSGYLGVSGTTSDQRDLVANAEQGNARAQLAVDIQRYQIKKYIGSYAAAMGGLDYVIFTGGIGENTPETRTVACEGLEFMGIKIDESVNSVTRGVLKDISTADSKVKVYVVPTDEELLIARDTMEIVTK